MADIGYGYGSEWHLLRFLGYHRNALDSPILRATGGQEIEWLDFPQSGPSRMVQVLANNGQCTKLGRRGSSAKRRA